MQVKYQELYQLLRGRGLIRLWLPSLTVAILLIESRWVHFKMLGNKAAVMEPRLEYCLLVSIIALLSLMPRGLSLAFGWLMTVVYSCLWIFDATYHRFFHDLPSWQLLPAWRQAGQSSQSLPSIILPTDLYILLAPALVGLITLASVARFGFKDESSRLIPMLLATASICSWLYINWAIPSVNKEQLQRRFYNGAIERLFGPIYYHVYDSYEYLRILAIKKTGAPFDAPRVKASVQQSRELALTKTPFKGMFEGRDFIFIQLESLEYFAIEAKYHDLPVMPFLEKMAKRGYQFRLFDQTHLGRSADAEFIYLNSIQPPADRPLTFAYPNVRLCALPQLFNEKGYNTIFVHPSDPSFWNAKIMAKNYGFQELVFDPELPIRDRAKEFRGWGLTDAALFERVLERNWDGDKPAFYYIVTLMCHHPYPDPSPEDTPFPPSKPKSMLRRYLRCCKVRDNAIEYLVDELGKTPRGRKAVLCLVGDHDSNIKESEKITAGLPVFPQSEAVPMILCSVEAALSDTPPLSSKAAPPNTFGGQMDVAPSIGHVFSLAMEQSVFLGWNLFAKGYHDPRQARIGTWMDQKGTIRSLEDRLKPLDDTQFEISDMLLQNDAILNTSKGL